MQDGYRTSSIAKKHLYYTDRKKVRKTIFENSFLDDVWSSKEKRFPRVQISKDCFTIPRNRFSRIGNSIAMLSGFHPYMDLPG